MSKENVRVDLAEKLEVIGQIFEIDGMADLLGKFEKDMNSVKFNAVTIQISALLLKDNKHVADKIIAMSKETTVDEVQKMDDAEYANALRFAILKDVMGFFASTPRTEDKK